MSNVSAVGSIEPSDDHITSPRAPGEGIVPGQPDMWVFVLFEGLTFGSYFVVYMLYRMGHSELFLRSQESLRQSFGVLNTLLLLTSSWFMARCVQAARRQAYNIALREVLLTALCGGAFVASKIVEWSERYTRDSSSPRTRSSGFIISLREFMCCMSSWALWSSPWWSIS